MLTCIRKAFSVNYFCYNMPVYLLLKCRKKAGVLPPASFRKDRYKTKYKFFRNELIRSKLIKQ